MQVLTSQSMSSRGSQLAAHARATDNESDRAQYPCLIDSLLLLQVEANELALVQFHATIHDASGKGKVHLSRCNCKIAAVVLSTVR